MVDELGCGPEQLGRRRGPARSARTAAGAKSTVVQHVGGPHEQAGRQRAHAGASQSLAMIRWRSPSRSAQLRRVGEGDGDGPGRLHGVDDHSPVAPWSSAMTRRSRTRRSISTGLPSPSMKRTPLELQGGLVVEVLCPLEGTEHARGRRGMTVAQRSARAISTRAVALQGDGLLPGRRRVVLLVVAVEPRQVRHRVQQRRRVGHRPMVAAKGASGEGRTSRRRTRPSRAPRLTLRGFASNGTGSGVTSEDRVRAHHGGAAGPRGVTVEPRRRQPPAPCRRLAQPWGQKPLGTIASMSLGPGSWKDLDSWCGARRRCRPGWPGRPGPRPARRSRGRGGRGRAGCLAFGPAASAPTRSSSMLSTA